MASQKITPWRLIDIARTVETSHRGVSKTNDKINQTLQCDASTINDDNTETPQCDVSTTSKNEKMQSIAHRCGRLSHIISQFKSAVTRHARHHHIPFGWQTRFYERVVRDQNEMNKIAQYIHENPYRWHEDEYYGCY